MGGRIYCHASGSVERLFSANGQDKEAGIRRMRSASNTGLVWSRYLDVWNGANPPEIVDGSTLREVLQTFANDFNGRGKLPASQAVKLLATIHQRQEQTLDRMRGSGTTLQATLETRFATGLGGPHPTETGFTFERSIGVPYLPGSSVKGLARAAADLRGEGDTKKETLFGPNQVRAESRAWAGDLVFLDAYPATWPRLELDIINCHHPLYYGGKRSYPAETEDPVPVYFLTVAAGTRFTFRVLSRSGDPKSASDGAELLRFGLKELGAGAKTAVGYGAFAG